MNKIAILAYDYHMVRLAELLLQREQYNVTCFGKVERLEASPRTFDLLIFDPGRLATARLLIERLQSWQPDAHRVMLTSAYENAKLAREYSLHLLFWPCSRQLFLAVVKQYNAFSEEELTRGTQP